LPLTSVASAIQAVAKLSPEAPSGLNCRVSERENAIGQNPGVVADLIEPRKEGYGYQLREGRIASLLEIIHRSSGELTPTKCARPWCVRRGVDIWSLQVCDRR
jgi:hypothetical protein